MPVTITPYKQTKPSYVNFRGIQDIRNYTRIDKFVARGGQPQSTGQIADLKKDGVGLIVNFRTLGLPMIDFDEAAEAKRNGIKYVSLPMISKKGPTDQDLATFSTLMEDTRQKDGKAYIHCAWGKDRTGIMSAFYKLKYGLDNLGNCITEMISRGHNPEQHPNLIPQLKDLAEKHFGITK